MVTDRKVKVGIEGDPSDFIRAMLAARAAVTGFGNALKTTGRQAKDLTKEIDTSNDRTTWLAQSVLALGPTFVPLGAAAIPVLAGVAAGLTLAAAAGGVMVLAFNGIGDALDAVNKYQLDPTAENFEKLQQALGDVGPAGAEFVAFLDSVGPKFSELQMLAREGMFPGMTEGITEVMDLLPQLGDIVTEISEAIGQLAAEAGEGLSGEGFAEFFDWLETNAKPLLVDMGRTLGNFAQGFGDMLVGFDPLIQDFSGGLLNMSRNFAAWADNLNESASFREFIAYVREAVPIVLDFLGSLVDAFVSLVEASAPVGEALLPVFGKLLDLIGAIAATPFGPVIIGITAVASALGRLAAIGKLASGGVLGGIFSPLTNSLKTAATDTKSHGAIIKKEMGQIGAVMATAGARTERESKKIGNSTKAIGKSLGSMSGSAVKIAGPLAAVGLSMSGLADDARISNTAMLGLFGTMSGSPWGVVAGAVIGQFLDLKAASDESAEAIDRWRDALDQSLAAGDFAGGANVLAQAREEYNKFKDDIESGDLGSYMDAVSNSFAGLFGESHVEQQEDALRGLEAQAHNTEGAARGLAEAFGIDITGGAAQQFAALQEVMAAAQPTMDALGITAQQLASAFAVKEGGGSILDQFKIGAGPAEDFDSLIAAIVNGAAEGGGAATEMSTQIAAAFARAETAAEAFTAAIEAANAALDTRANMRDYESALDAATAALKENGKTLDITTEKGRANQAALDAMASSAVKMAEDMGVLKGPEFLKDARKDFINMAVAMGMGRRAAAGLATELGLIGKVNIDMDLGSFNKKIRDARNNLSIFDRWRVEPTADLDAAPFAQVLGVSVRDLKDFDSDKAKPGVQLDDAAFKAAVRAVRALLAGLDGDTATTYVRTVHYDTYTGDGRDQRGGPQKGALGLTVPDDGGPYYDRFHALLAPREEVVSNRYGGADRNRYELKAASKGAKLAITGFANGGTVGTSVFGPAGADSVMHRNAGDSIFDDLRRQLNSTFVSFEKVQAFWLQQQMKQLDKWLKASEKHVESLKEDVDAAKQVRDEWRSTMDSFADTIASRFAPTGSDLFADVTGITGVEDRAATPEDIMQRLLDKQKEGREFDKLTFELKKLGLDEDPLQALLEHGSLDLLNQYAAMSPEEIAKFEAQFNRTNTTAERAGADAGFVVFGERLSDSVAELQKVKHHLQVANMRHERAEKQRDKLNERIEKLEAATKNVGEDVADNLDKAAAKSARRK